MTLQQLIETRPIKPKTALAKLATVKQHVSNWHNLVIDKWVRGDNIVYQFRNGASVECRRQSTDINEAVVVLSGIEYPEQLCILPTHKGVVVDVGTNIGTFGVYIERLNQGKDYQLFAFEPFAENAELAKRNFEHNGMSNFQLSQKAISGKNGTVKFDISGAFDAHKISQSGDGVEVETITLSSFCQSQNIDTIDILKMDIEGSEFDVLAVDGDFICKHVKVLLMEYHLSSQHPTIEHTIAMLTPHFEVLTENMHAGGGMLLAVRK